MDLHHCVFWLLRWLTSSADCFESPNPNLCKAVPILIHGALYLFTLHTSRLLFGRSYPRSETGDDDGARVLSLENVVPWYFIASCTPIFVDWLIHSINAPTKISKWMCRKSKAFEHTNMYIDDLLTHPRLYRSWAAIPQQYYRLSLASTPTSWPVVQLSPVRSIWVRGKGV